MPLKFTAKQFLMTAVLTLAALTLGASYYVDSSFSHTVLVPTAGPVVLPRMQFATSCEVCDDGPNPEWCAAGVQNPQDGGCPVFPDGGFTVKLGTGMKVPAGQCKSLPYVGTTMICCQVETADQVDGGGTEINEAP